MIMGETLKTGDMVTVKEDETSTIDGKIFKGDEVVKHAHVAAVGGDSFTFKAADATVDKGKVVAERFEARKLADEGKTWLRGHVHSESASALKR